jgi:hypothetical protein
MQEPDERPEMRAIPALPEKFSEGRDELNFAEFPLGTIAERIDPTVKTLHFEDRIFDKSKNDWIPRKLTITGSDAHGLPTSTDDEVLLGLLQLTKLQQFKDRRVFFSRYQLIKLLRWPVNGQSYDRIDQALNRWIGVTLYYQNAWRDRETNQWVDEKFHILERIKIYSQENERSRPKPDPGQGSFEFASSFFVWNDAVYRSFTSGNIKSLDYDFVLELESSISRRLYRFLDKRFYKARNLSFELKNLSYEHIGLSRNSPVADLKRKLLTAIDELVGKQFLKPLPKEQRFRKERAGVWHVHFEKSDFVPVAANKASAETKTAPPGSETDLSETTAVIQKLVDAGVRLETAVELAGKYPAAYIESKIQLTEHLTKTKSKKVSDNPPGFLITAIRTDIPLPRSFVTPEQKQAKEEAKKKRQEVLQQQEAKRKEREEAAERERRRTIDQFWASLPKEDRIAAEAEALSQADRMYQDLLSKGGSLAEAARQNLMDDYALERLSQG